MSFNLREFSPALHIKNGFQKEAKTQMAGPPLALEAAFVVGAMSAHHNSGEIVRDFRNFARDDRAQTGTARLAGSDG